MTLAFDTAKIVYMVNRKITNTKGSLWMNDREFQKFLEESKRRNRHNGYSYTDTPTSYEVPAFTKSERKNIESVIRSITPRDRYMPTRKTTKNNLKTFLMSFDSYEQLPSKIEDLIIGTCRSFGRDNYHRKVFYLLRMNRHG